MLTDTQLAILISFLDNVEAHKDCLSKPVDDPWKCLEVIIYRYDRYEISNIKELLERELLSR